MSPALVKVIKTILMAVAAAALHALIQTLPQIVPLLPAKYAGLASVAAIAAALYHKQPPSGDGGSRVAAGMALLPILFFSGCNIPKDTARPSTIAILSDGGLR